MTRPLQPQRCTALDERGIDARGKRDALFQGLDRLIGTVQEEQACSSDTVGVRLDSDRAFPARKLGCPFRSACTESSCWPKESRTRARPVATGAAPPAV